MTTSTDAALSRALEFQYLLQTVGDRLKEYPDGRSYSYLSPDGLAYVLAVNGKGAKEMQEFMKSVGRYLMKIRFGRKNTDHSKAEEEFDAALQHWLSTLEL